MITARILADSINPAGSRLTSFLLTYNRFIHSEFMTHRVFSRNAASSRARPLAKVIDGVLINPAYPEKWGKEQKGMQSGDELCGAELAACQRQWQNHLEAATYIAHYLSERGLHKSLCNRILEPFDHITVVATAEAKGLSNFFALRANPEAQPEFQVLAYRMLDAYLKSEPEHIEWGHWHIPDFGKPIPDGRAEVTHIIKEFSAEEKLKIATARCARLSYLTHEGEHSPEKDIELHDRLLSSRHLSPFEHCARATQQQEFVSNFDQVHFSSRGGWTSVIAGLSSWDQYRKMIEGENQTNANLSAIFGTKPDWITL